MLRAEDVAFGVGHQAEDAAGRIAHAGHVALRAVWVDGKWQFGKQQRSPREPGAEEMISASLPLLPACPLAYFRRPNMQYDLPRLGEPLEDPLLAADKRAFAVSDRQLQPIDVLEPNSIPRRRGHVDPAVLDGLCSSSRERGQRALLVRRDQQAGFEDHLEAIADAEDQLLLVAERANFVGEEGHQLVCEDLAGRDVVAVTEPAGDAENLVIVEARSAFSAQAIDVDKLGLGALALKSELRFAIAVGARGSGESGRGGRPCGSV